jgi:hypothetical protein
MRPGSGSDLQTSYFAIPREVVVVADDGVQTQWSDKIMNISPATIVLAFAMKDPERNFTLVWPGYPGVKLNPLLYLLP